MRRLLLGTAGHIDHGKTALVRALTGIDTDRLPEEKRRGITIDLGFAHLALEPDLELAIVDVPGHEAFIRNMLAGATGFDLALLVIAADEGIMPQTREHLAILQLLDIPSAIVAITKTDLVEPEWLELVHDEVRDALRPTPYAAAPIVPVSSTTGLGLDTLRDALRHTARQTPERSPDDLFRLPLDRVFTIRGTGTVVTGTVWSGRITRDQTVRILPAGLAARVRAIQVHGRDTPTATAGQRAALALAGIERDQLRRGNTLVDLDAWNPTTLLTASLRLLPDAPAPLRHHQRIRFHLGTAEVMGRIALLSSPTLEPGTTGWAQIRLEQPVVARAGDRFVLRSYSPITTIGGGTVAEPDPPKRARLETREASLLHTILTGPDTDALAARVELAGLHGAPIPRLPLDTPLSPTRIHAALHQLEGTTLLRIGDRAFTTDIARTARHHITSTVHHYHTLHPLRPGIDREELRRTLPHPAPPTLADWAIQSLLADHTLTSHGSTIAAAGFTPRLDPDQQHARDRLLATYQAAGLTPPTLAELPPDLRQRHDLRPLLKLLEQDQLLVPLNPDLYAARSAIDDAIARLRKEMSPNKTFTPKEIRRILPVSRKYLIPLLEYFDRAGITLRRGDERTLLPASPAAPPGAARRGQDP